MNSGDKAINQSLIRQNVKKEGDHYLWTGPRNFGVGAPKLGKEYVRNIMWEISKDEKIPEGMMAERSCAEDACVAIAHLQLIPLQRRQRAVRPPTSDTLALEERVAELERQMTELHNALSDAGIPRG